MSRRGLIFTISETYVLINLVFVLMILVLAQPSQSAIQSSINQFFSTHNVNHMSTEPFSTGLVVKTGHMSEPVERARFWKIDMSQCMSLVLLKAKSASGNQQVQLQFKVNESVLSHMYENRGPCRRVVHADAMEMFGLCYEVNIHVTNRGDFHRCKKRFPADRVAYRMCVWNTNNVETSATVPVPGGVGVVKAGDKVSVKMFDKPNCVVPRDMGTLVVIAEDPSDEDEDVDDNRDEDKEEVEEVPNVSGSLVYDSLPQNADITPAPPTNEPGL